MTRKWIDCRDFGDSTGCTLYISGEEDHVVNAAAEHAESVHGEKDTPELRNHLRGMLKDETAMARP
jgi:predicted small metal-binding protein